MTLIIVYLLGLAALDTSLLLFVYSPYLPRWIEPVQLLMVSGLVGGIGGAVYCIRGVYLHASVHADWDTRWHIWYYLRPLVSHVCGALTYVFIAAGLIVLEAAPATNSTNLGFIALAFVAGLNVDRFLNRIENLTHSTWGIKKSRATEDSDGDKNL